MDVFLSCFIHKPASLKHQLYNVNSDAVEFHHSCTLPLATMKYNSQFDNTLTSYNVMCLYMCMGGEDVCSVHVVIRLIQLKYSSYVTNLICPGSYSQSIKSGHTRSIQYNAFNITWHQQIHLHVLYTHLAISFILLCTCTCIVLLGEKKTMPAHDIKCTQAPKLCKRKSQLLVGSI